MGGESVTRGPEQPARAGDDDATQFLGHDPAAGPRPTTSAGPPHPPTEIVPPPPSAGPPHPPTEIVPPGPEAGIVRFGPGVPFSLPDSRGGQTAEHVWRQQPAPRRRWRSLRRLLGSALTVILLAAAGVVLYLRFYHPPFQVTGVTIAQQARAGCGADVTGRVSTNGAAGTISYQWLFRPGRAAGQPLSQSVTAGQHAANVTVAVEGSGHGSASETVTLQVLSPGRRTASTTVIVSC
jgi:hypothetical protein